jgi:hypothetical protein
MQPVVVFRLSKFRKRILFAFAFVAFIFGTSFGGGGVSAADVDDDGGAKASSQCVANVPKWRQTNLCQKNLVIFAHDTEFYGSLTRYRILRQFDREEEIFHDAVERRRN